MSQLPNRSNTPCPPYTPHFVNFASSPRISTTLLGPPVSNLSKQLRANESNSPKLSPIDNVLFGYPPNTPSNRFGPSTSTHSTPELSPIHSSASSTPERPMHTMNHHHPSYHQMQHWDASNAHSSNPPSPMSLSPALGRMSLNTQPQQMGMPMPVYPSQQPMSIPDTETPAVPQKKIPRPPNAFMIYRSHTLKAGVIPNSAERKQQALSKVVGQMWAMMTQEEKKVWRDKAAEVLVEHAKMYPGYKFNPSPKGTKKKTGNASAKGGEEDAADAARIRELREKYTKYQGPSPVSSRKRKGRKAHSVDDSKSRGASGAAGKRAKSYEGDERNVYGDVVFAQPSSLPPGVITFANYSMAMGQQQQQHHYHPVHPSPLRNTAVPRRPSTSMGFSETHKHMMFPMPDTRDARISAARNANGQQMSMQVNGMIHETTFPTTRFENPTGILSGIFPFGLAVPQTQNPTGTSSEPSSSPSSRYNNMYDPENPFTQNQGTCSSTSSSSSHSSPSSPPRSSSASDPSPRGGLDFSKFNYNGQSYNLSKAILPPLSSPSPNAMDTSSPPSHPHPQSTGTRTAPANTLTIDIEYPSSLGLHSGDASGGGGASASSSTNSEDWIFAEMDVDGVQFEDWTYYSPGEGDVSANVNMGASI